MAHLVDAFRAVLLRGELPPAASVIYLLLVPTAILAAGFWWYRRASYRFADHL
jgi:ABC-type polysaccharide/polyol phosphate export permease